MKYAFIADYKTQFSIGGMCRALSVSRSSFYEWQQRGISARQQSDAALLHRIREVDCTTHGNYGAVKTWKALQQAGVACGKHRVARLRRQAGIESRRKRRFRVTVEHHKMPQAAPDLLTRYFQAAKPNQVWVGDMTFIQTRAGWLYLTMLMDLYSRRIVGWSMSDKPNEALARGALDMAVVHRQPALGLIHHTDQGAIYRSTGYQQRMESCGIQPSMGGKKSAYDNAPAESFFSTLKNELIHHIDFKTRDEARSAVFAYIELFYNARRLHQALNYQSPMQYEARADMCLY
ncbi:MAG TPA: IS3 family transposase [Spongiibacteraceae bacterium]|nr:IS3 family transposase [Spongiibacteraceae bacterium]